MSEFKIVELAQDDPSKPILHRVSRDEVEFEGSYEYTYAHSLIHSLVQDDDTVIDEYTSSGRTITWTGKEWRAYRARCLAYYERRTK
jgi:hypothetical protein